MRVVGTNKLNEDVLSSMESAMSKDFEEAGKASSSDTIWTQVCARFKNEFGDHAYQSWLVKLAYQGVDGSSVTLGAPSKFVRDWIERHYGSRLRDFFRAENPRLYDVNIRIDESLGAAAGADTHAAAGSVASGSRGSSGSTSGASEDGILDPRYTFDSFVVGKSNEFAYHAAKRVAESRDVPFNPLFLHGGVGLGKTHLMHAIAWEVRASNPDKRVSYISAERFMHEFISAIRFKETLSFKQKYRTVDVLMVDDIQFIAGNKGSTQEEFFHTFNALIDNRCQLVITGDRSPTDMEGIEERIISRLGWGLVADIHPTDYELRLGILQSKAEQTENVDVPEDVLEFLAQRITSNVRELEGALNRVTAYATLVGRPITIDMARDVLQDLLRANDRKLTIDEIQRTVADYFNIRLSEMLSERRARVIARPRQVAMYLSKQMTSRSLPEIGRRFGGRDHTTVMHAVRKIEDLRRGDSQLNEDLARLSRQLED